MGNSRKNVKKICVAKSQLKSGLDVNDDRDSVTFREPKGELGHLFPGLLKNSGTRQAS